MPRKHITYYEVLEAFGTSECPICNLVDKSMRQRMDALLHEQVNDPGTRRKLVESRGFCAPHSRVFLELGHPLGVALIFGDILDAVINDLERNSTKHTGKCPACQWAASDESRYLSVLAAHFDDENMHDAIVNSRGFCLPHLRALMSLLSQAQRSDLRQIIISHLVSLRSELSEIVRKSDYRCNEPFGQERDAWIRVVEKLSGVRSADRSALSSF